MHNDPAHHRVSAGSDSVISSSVKDSDDLSNSNNTPESNSLQPQQQQQNNYNGKIIRNHKKELQKEFRVPLALVVAIVCCALTLVGVLLVHTAMTSSANSVARDFSNHLATSIANRVEASTVRSIESIRSRLTSVLRLFEVVGQSNDAKVWDTFALALMAPIRELGPVLTLYLPSTTAPTSTIRHFVNIVDNEGLATKTMSLSSTCSIGYTFGFQPTANNTVHLTRTFDLSTGSLIGQKSEAVKEGQPMNLIGHEITAALANENETTVYATENYFSVQQVVVAALRWSWGTSMVMSVGIYEETVSGALRRAISAFPATSKNSFAVAFSSSLILYGTSLPSFPPTPTSIRGQEHCKVQFIGTLESTIPKIDLVHGTVPDIETFVNRSSVPSDCWQTLGDVATVVPSVDAFLRMLHDGGESGEYNRSTLFRSWWAAQSPNQHRASATSSLTIVSSFDFRGDYYSVVVKKISNGDELFIAVWNPLTDVDKSLREIQDVMQWIIPLVVVVSLPLSWLCTHLLLLPLTTVIRDLLRAQRLDLDGINITKRSRLFEVNKLQIALSQLVLQLRELKAYLPTTVRLAAICGTPDSSRSSQSVSPKSQADDGTSGFSRSGDQWAHKLSNTLGSDQNTSGEHATNNINKNTMNATTTDGLPAMELSRRGVILHVLCFDVERLLGAGMSWTFAADMSQRFTATAVTVLRASGGTVVNITATSVTAVWNVYKQTPKTPGNNSNECTDPISAACRGALSLSRALRSARVIGWGGAISSGRLLYGICGTMSQRFPIVYGECFEDVQHLAALARETRSEFLVTESVYNAQPRLYMPVVDSVRLISHGVHGLAMNVFDLRGALPDDADECMRIVEGNSHLSAAFQLFKKHDYSSSLREIERAREAYPRSEWHLERLRGLAMYFLHHPDEASRLPSPYCRLSPQWSPHELISGAVTSFGGGAGCPSAADARRSMTSDTASEVQRIQNDVTRRMFTDGDGSQFERTSSGGGGGGNGGRGKTDADCYFESFLEYDDNEDDESSSNSGNEDNEEQDLRDFDEELSAEETKQRRESKAKVKSKSTKSNNKKVVQFKDSRGFLWRKSAKLLGRGAYGDVHVGIGTKGQFVAIKAIPIPHAHAMWSSSHPHSVGHNTDASSTPYNHPSMLEVGSASADMLKDPSKVADELVREVTLLSQLKHNNIVGYKGCAVVGRSLYVVMEFISGGSLYNILEDYGALPPVVLRRFSRDILRGLTFLHEREIVHRDVKPHNVLVTAEGVCKLTDFGASAKITHLSGPGSVIGTPHYMSPEQCCGVLGTASDIWAFGVLVCHLSTGCLPWSLAVLELPPVMFCARLSTDDALMPVIPRIPELGPDFAAFVGACFERHPDRRPTAGQLLTHPFLDNTQHEVLMLSDVVESTL